MEPQIRYQKHLSLSFAIKAKISLHSLERFKLILHLMSVLVLFSQHKLEN